MITSRKTRRAGRCQIWEKKQMDSHEISKERNILKILDLNGQITLMWLKDIDDEFVNWIHL
jgi:hypothetical protein